MLLPSGRRRRELYEANGRNRVYMHLGPPEIAPLPQRFADAGFERTRCVVDIDVSKHGNGLLRSYLSRIEITYKYPKDARGHALTPLRVEFDLYKLKPYLELIGFGGVSDSTLWPIRRPKRNRTALSRNVMQWSHQEQLPGDSNHSAAL